MESVSREAVLAILTEKLGSVRASLARGHISGPRTPNKPLSVGKVVSNIGR